MLFSLYTSELFDVISQHLPTAHSYADDTGIYLAFNPNDDSNQDAAIAAMEACLCDIRNWMINDKLMINDSKTELRFPEIQCFSLSIEDISWRWCNQVFCSRLTKRPDFTV